MTREIAERPIKQPDRVEVRIIGATCDRCGDSALCNNASAENGLLHAGPWGVVKCLEQGKLETYEADLCRSCGEELRDWIERGPYPDA